MGAGTSTPQLLAERQKYQGEVFAGNTFGNNDFGMWPGQTKEDPIMLQRKAYEVQKLAVRYAIASSVASDLVLIGS